jgi:hypothetical protein
VRDINVTLPELAGTCLMAQALLSMVQAQPQILQPMLQVR